MTFTDALLSNHPSFPLIDHDIRPSERFFHLVSGDLKAMPFEQFKLLFGMPGVNYPMQILSLCMFCVKQS